MHRHSINTASFFSVLIAGLIFSLSLAWVAAAQGNTSLGTGALQNNTTGGENTASGVQASAEITSVSLSGNRKAKARCNFRVFGANERHPLTSLFGR
jgi:hypothetical protein